MSETSGLYLLNTTCLLKDLKLEFDFSLESGKTLALIGPSGGGKTSLLNLIAGFLYPLQGEIWYEGKSIKRTVPGERPVSMLFQEHNLFPHLSIFENVAIGLESSLKLSASQKETVEKALSDVELHGMDNRKPSTLSGGQRQRVALARSLVRKKPLLLLDEPFSALDPGLTKSMMAILKQLKEAHSLTMVYATHDPIGTLGFADQVAFIEDGHIRELGTPEELLDPNRRSNAMRAYLGE